MDFKTILPHLIAIVVLIVGVAIYFQPVMQGKVLNQSDNLQARGMQAEMRKYMDEGRRVPLWTNQAFSGMPTYQLGGSGPGNLMRLVNKALLLGKGVTASHLVLFIAALSMYILMLVLGVDWRLGIFAGLTFALCTHHLILAEAGHSTKLLALAYTPGIIAGVLLTFRERYLAGGALLAFFLSLQVYANHIQITYYLFLMLGIFGVIKLIDAARENNWMPFLKAAGVAIVAVLLAFMSNTTRIWTTQEYGEETIRGGSELQASGQGDGLTKEYAFGWSYGIGETATLMFPNARGGGSIMNTENTETYKRIRQPAGGLLYWGDQPFTSGPVYFGAVLCFLFILGAFLYKDSLRWWLVISTGLAIILAWGRHFPSINYFMFDYFPFYNKFRAVYMILDVAQIIVIMLGLLGLQQFFKRDVPTALKQRALLWSGGIAVGICLLMYMIAMGMSFSGPNDEQWLNNPNLGAAFVDLLESDRAAMLRGDIGRSLLLILLAAGALFASLRVKMQQIHIYSAVAVGVLMLGDMWTVSKRYVNGSSFEERASVNNFTEPTQADLRIMQDTEPYFRVLDLTRGNPYSSALASYHHKSLGGYHAAKLMVYQEMTERYIPPNNPYQYPQILGMLNTKYIINQTQQGGPPSAVEVPGRLGNVWFVNNYNLVPDADTELNALATLNPSKTVVVQQKYADYLSGLNLVPDSLRNPSDYIQLSNYDPEVLTYDYKASGEQLAVFSEIYYPPAKGWKVFIDGQEVDGFIKANYALRALRLPAGEHTIEMRFEPRSFIVGERLSLFGSLIILLSVLGVCFLTFRRADWSKVSAAKLEALPEAAKKSSKARTSGAKTKTSSTKAKPKKKRR